jgi:hypothetical protein
MYVYLANKMAVSVSNMGKTVVIANIHDFYTGNFEEPVMLDFR